MAVKLWQVTIETDTEKEQEQKGWKKAPRMPFKLADERRRVQSVPDPNSYSKHLAREHQVHKQWEWCKSPLSPQLLYGEQTELLQGPNS